MKEYGLTVKDAAKIVGKSPAAIRYWMDFKDLEYSLIDCGWGRPQQMINENDLKEFIDEKEKAGQ